MAASSPGDPRALVCRYCGSQRAFLRRTLVCATCDDTPRWPGGALDPSRGARDGADPGPAGTPPNARHDEDGAGPA